MVATFKISRTATFFTFVLDPLRRDSNQFKASGYYVHCVYYESMKL